ncbi:YqzG/YhdC family protein [Bacillus sonorensis]|uniref:YqzG/YhdC family protein n=1 Tax=Bacillus sonorensis TaxID=119858 RepID=UPI0004976411|nr:YqzG/YhdC family protein [Bacillus sonorensis]MBG9916486.1 hypothetical protein [Bacillus sonorensis]MCF7619578.1 YqzG/YhdC family protein [Bacillus sonorensis]MCY7855941.1 YqzG/YhdC family protein [Bacillus sonorensis]MCY8025578.1 YqzG/YhdC family protein [Bacillus sonorensis]MCY8032818.1 YqzG/YhdC family protein [Bacillus sonorensis]
MKKCSYPLFFSLIVLTSLMGHSHPAEGGRHSVDRWERIAWSALEEKYQDAQLKDYEYIGRTRVNDEQIKDVFRVTVNQDGKTFPVHAEVYFHPVTNIIISVHIFPL